ncbi:DUF4276 domain-containing protein [Candidatus Ornithobacterium hominis]|uniref:DUF4276 family protein n=1 Tax=Candidatus Ornithobacterium hominis TaxID=2497989 RepID=UPI0024BC1971|nr:DUF4276 family protein [Candidatus Ornithobacterium hominis]CAI9429395.1 DUF4276 domain-containing protein [Candidatus Ornithobacterium hominis]
MKRLLIIVEGDTEKEFIDKVLSPYLYTKGLQSVDCFKIKHTKGGLTKYQHIKTDLINCVYENNVLVSTIIDFYALPKDFPKYEDAKRIVNKDERLSFLETAIIEDIETEKGKSFPNLLPYIQLHEFEALVFSSIDAIRALYSEHDAKFYEIEQVMATYPNPEDINDSPQTAPSKRLKNNQLIKGYNKVNDGIMIIEEAGIDVVLAKCPRFGKWVEKLIEKVKQ